MTDWKREAAALGFPVFPVQIRNEGGKWRKVPLVKSWQVVACSDVDGVDWSGANGYGIVTGSRSCLYAFDIDSYKTDCAATDWMREHRVPLTTRTHGTVSGGTHKLYRLTPHWDGLPTRANVVPGLDTRGEGGFVAFGEGYRVLCNAEIATLPDAACMELYRGALVEERRTFEYVAPAPDAVEGALDRALTFGPEILRARWQGSTDGLRDTSRSGMDLSVAKLLAIAGLDPSEIVYALLHQFRHGTAARDGVTPTTRRAAQRCAERAVASTDTNGRSDDWLQHEMRKALRRWTENG